MFGKHHSYITREKISTVLTGRKLTTKHKENISRGLRGRTYEEIYGCFYASVVAGLMNV